MEKILIIARHEFRATVLRAGFVLTLIGMPLFFVVVPGVLIFVMSAQSGSADSGGPIAVVDKADLVGPSLVKRASEESDQIGGQEGRRPRQARFVAYDDLDRALADLKIGRIAACYVLEADYEATGEVASYTREGGLFSSLWSRQAEELDEMVRRGLLTGRVSGEVLDRVIKPVTLKENTLSRDGGIKQVKSGLEKIAGILLPFGMFILLSTAILASSSYLLQSTAEERENRVIEILISSVKPTQLLVGKMIGLGAAGLLQVAVYVVVMIFPAVMFFSAAGIGSARIVMSVVYVILGYLLFASLMAATGMLSNTVQESTQYSMIWAAFSILPILLIQPLSSAPNSTLARALSYFPLTAPGTMILRTVMSNVSLLDNIISIIGLILGTALAVKGAAKLFRAASLMYGKRFNAAEIIRWLREA